MDCPHCGGWIAAGAPKPIEHPCFDDATRCVVVDGSRRRLPLGEWRLLGALRERFGRFVTRDFLAQACAADPLEGGSIRSATVRICRLRRRLAGAPFAIATSYAHGYGLFRADQVIADGRPGRQRNFRLRPRADLGAAAASDLLALINPEESR